MLTEDEIVRMFRDMGLMRARGLGSSACEPEETAEQWVERTSGSTPLWDELCRLCGLGEINRAENLLFEGLDISDVSTFPSALGFCGHLNRFSDKELEAWDYSREEIFDGLRDCAEQYGVDPQLLEAFRS